MEQNTPVIAKKIWSIMKVAFFMLRKGICKRKLLMDLNLMMKRGKIAGKALQNLMFHLHHHNHHHPTASQVGLSGPPGQDYEFSCSNTPLYRHYFTNKRKNNQNYMPAPMQDINNIEAVNNMFDMMMLSGNDSVAPSPMLSGLGFDRSPAARQLTITGSPSPVQADTEINQHVDEAADEFIKNFYSQLKHQKSY